MAVFETRYLAATLEARPRDVLEAEAYLQRSPRNGFSMLRIAFAFGAALAMFAGFNSQAHAAQCGSSSAGFDAWKQEFAGEARAKGVSASTIQALMATNYAQATINADRGQRSFKLSLDQFLAKRGATTIVAKGRQLKASQAALFASIQRVTACRRGRCSRSGGWRPGSAASAATRTCSPRSRRWPMTAGARPISPSIFTRRCN